MTNAASHIRRGFTLVEMVLSMTVMTILLGGIASAMILASRAMPDVATPLTNTVEGYHATDQVGSELYAAQSFTIMSPTDVQFTVADRNNDGAPETIRYTWSGVAGAPLKRQYNSDAAADLVDNVNEFALTYDRRVVVQTQASSPTESAETQLVSYDTVSNLSDYGVDKDKWVGQYFKPSLPADVTSWKVTRVKIQVRVHGANKGATAVQLQPSNVSNLPSGTVLDEVQLSESSLSDTYLWREFPFSKASGIAPTQGICLVLKWISDAHSCDAHYVATGVTMPNSNLVDSSNGGTSWTARTSQSLLFYVYGTMTAPTPPQTLHLYYLTGVQIKLRVGSDPNARVQTAVQILNQPEVTGI
jgi:prepilin-type N-terminal cleavage/methylation domain-containing protein